MNNQDKNYDDIINLPHHQSLNRKHMSNYDRAAQFAPFAALTGHSEAIQETARFTDTKVTLDDNKIDEINGKLSLIRDHLNEHPIIEFTYFVEDKKKKGGAYAYCSGIIKRIDDVEHKLYLTDGSIIAIDDLFSINCELFRL